MIANPGLMIPASHRKIVFYFSFRKMAAAKIPILAAVRLHRRRLQVPPRIRVSVVNRLNSSFLAFFLVILLLAAVSLCE
jgi:hypothetical protein